MRAVGGGYEAIDGCREWAEAAMMSLAGGGRIGDVVDGGMAGYVYGWVGKEGAGFAGDNCRELGAGYAVGSWRDHMSVAGVVSYNCARMCSNTQ